MHLNINKIYLFIYSEYFWFLNENNSLFLFFLWETSQKSDELTPTFVLAWLDVCINNLSYDSLAVKLLVRKGRTYECFYFPAAILTHPPLCCPFPEPRLELDWGFVLCLGQKFWVSWGQFSFYLNQFALLNLNGKTSTKIHLHVRLHFHWVLCWQRRPDPYPWRHLTS